METKVEFSAKPGDNNVRLVTQTNGKHTPENGNEIVSLGRERRGRRLPQLFDRSSKKWWNPQMDSEVLEKQSQIFALPLRRSYFQQGLLLIIISSICWMIFFGVNQDPASWVAGIIWCAALLSVCIITLIVMQLTNWFNTFSVYLALVVTISLIATVVVTAWFGSEIMASASSFSLVAVVVLLLHWCMPLPMHICFMLSVATCVCYEVVYHLLHSSSTGNIIEQVLLIVCCLAIVLHLQFYSEVWIRSSFWKVGQQITSNLSAEFKKIMIDSIMPKSVSEELLKKQNLFKTNGQSIFRPLFVQRMDDVSILYADIVGFTRMSANKTAAQLVYLLNDLFRRFDTLCLKTGCEKISTLGDCYYCVSGCPDPKADHARCCVEMGLGMIAAIKDFCEENNVNVDMRIGIHTGIVMCGIVGVRRFKFDVWSNDVSFANQMEQWGVPGRIHISEETRECLEKLGQEYEIEDGNIEERAPKEVLDSKKFKTFLIRKRIGEDSDTSSMSDGSSDTPDAGGGDKGANSKVKIVNERWRTKSNGTKSDKASVKKKCTIGDAAHENLAHSGDGAHDNVGGGKSSSRRVSSRRPHHSTRNKSRKRIPDDQKIKQVKIYELIGMHGMMPFLDSKVREKQDVEFINSIKDNSRMKGCQVQGLLSSVKLEFNDEKIEKVYRDNFVNEVIKNEQISSFANMRISFYTSLFLSCFVLLLVSFASIAGLNPSVETPAWLVIFFWLLILVIVITLLYQIPHRTSSVFMQRRIKQLTSWWGRNIIGAVVLLCPFFVLVSHMWRHGSSLSCGQFLIVMNVVAIHSTTFSQLNWMMRSCFAVLFEIIMLLLVYVNPSQQPSVLAQSAANSTDSTTTATTVYGVCSLESTPHQYEYIVVVIPLLILIILKNRVSEDHFRRTCHNAYEAEATKNQSVDELLHHIIPPRVTAVIREQKTYSKDHSNVGVVFASITNFNEFYEEQFAGGKECIRILNELIGDVDELLDRKEFGDIEKIKTIGSTFMIAAGLDPNIERDLVSHSHLRMLMEFCIQMQRTIQAFSENMVAFTFVLRIGFNHGSVTAGVIGTTKLLYDIWGDTVNIASRMDSTGVPGKIQVSEGSMHCLKDKYDFEHRGSTFVKGKGQMETYLVKSAGSTVDDTNNANRKSYNEYT